VTRDGDPTDDARLGRAPGEPARPGDALFRAWSASEAPDFDAAAGRARFLERFARQKARPSRARVLVLASAPALAAAAFAVVWLLSSTIGFRTAAGDGQAGAWLATTSAGELPITFSEGTELVMGADSRGRVDALTRSGASFLLERGEVRAHVVHRARTHWRFLAGPFEVEVTGTVLGVDWDPARERFAVHVDEGAVVVRGPSVGAPQVVRAGEQCVVDLPARTTHISPIEAPSAAAAAPVASARPADAGPEEPAEGVAAAPASPSPSGGPAAPRAAPAVTWSKLEERGDYDAAYTAARAAGLAAVLRASSADELLRLAQVARLSGHRDTEREALVTCRRRFPGTERAAVAAYELGRSSSPSEASSWFDTYLGEQPSGPLAREAAGRLVEARASAGDDRGAREAASRYLARYPDGPHAPLARRVLGGAHE
jgi:TolA-binding protein